MNSELIRKLAIQQLQEEETKKKEKEIQEAVLAEVERLRARPATELVKDDLSEMKQQLKELRQRVDFLEAKAADNSAERNIFDLATLMGDSTLSFRSGLGITKRKFRASYTILNNGSNNNWDHSIMIGGMSFSLSIDYSKRILQIITHTNNENRKVIEYSFRECQIDPHEESKAYDMNLEITLDQLSFHIGNVLYKKELVSSYRPANIFENGFIVPYTNRFGARGFFEYY